VSELYVALLHHPVYDRHGQVVTTAVTNIDIHDIARSCKTFDVRAFYVVTPVDSHRALARRIVRHWQSGHGVEYNPSRHEALELAQLERTLEGVEIDIERRNGRLPRLIATSAKPLPRAVAHDVLRREMAGHDSPFLLLLGTGWGLTREIIERSHHHLAPIDGAGAYNHLSVRAAAAILLDRLAGKR
jgi:hypothetical protein